MDSLLDSLPERPLTREEALKVCDHEVVEWGAAPAATDEGEVYTFLLVFPDTAYGLGYDEDDQQWGVIHSVDRDTEGSVAELDREMNAWAKRLYGDMASDIAPNLPDVGQYK